MNGVFLEFVEGNRDGASRSQERVETGLESFPLSVLNQETIYVGGHTQRLINSLGEPGVSQRSTQSQRGSEQVFPIVDHIL
jgi:hypothetical protein